MSNLGTSNRGERGRGPGGFTLLEIVIVVSVVAIFVGLAVPRLPDVAGTRIHRNARKIISILKLTRSRAVSLRRYYRLDMDLDAGTLTPSYFGPEGTYVIDEEVRTVQLPEGAVTDVVTTGGGKVVEGTGHIGLSPRGFVEPALIHLGDGTGRWVTVVPFPVSGRVQIREGYLEMETDR